MTPIRRVIQCSSADADLEIGAPQIEKQKSPGLLQGFDENKLIIYDDGTITVTVRPNRPTPAWSVPEPESQ